MTWSLRSLLSPVVTRLLIYGVNPIDLERIVGRIEAAPLRNSTELETRWIREWGSLKDKWSALASAAEGAGHRKTARALRFHECGCSLAQFLINNSSLETRRQVYTDYAECYRAAVALESPPAQPVAIPLPNGGTLSAILHLPEDGGARVPCAVVLAGLGSCKEEMHALARTVVARGVAALVPDMPGSGGSLFFHGQSCSGPAIESALRAVADFLTARPEVDAARMGAIGLCMGGGYAFRAAAIDPRYQFCVSLFPLFIDQVDFASTPQWMRSGEWYNFQAGGIPAQAFMEQMGLSATDRVCCPFFLVYGNHDNWMKPEQSAALLARTDPERTRVLVIEEPAALTQGNATTHAMPVGEQMHWVVPAAADWIADQVGRDGQRTNRPGQTSLSKHSTGAQII